MPIWHEANLTQRRDRRLREKRILEAAAGKHKLPLADPRRDLGNGDSKAAVEGALDG